MRPTTAWRDVALSLVLAWLTIVGIRFAGAAQPEARPIDTVGWALLLVGPVVLLARRRYPVPVLAVATAAPLTFWIAGYPYGPVFLAALAALATVISGGHRAAGYGITAAAFVTGVVTYVVRHPEAGPPLAGGGAWLAWLAAFLAGCELWRARRQRLAQEREAAAEAQRRHGMQERLRIARELHDSLGYHVSLINVQAGVALYLIDDDPAQVRAALETIKAASRDLLAEMRSTLGVLRGVDEDPPRTPVAGLARLDDLLADNRSAGLRVTLDVRGTPRELPASVDLAAYRIVQESLTNTRRHAGAVSATVVIEYTDDGVTVQVDDDGAGHRGHAAPGSGSGLPGMRERATALGGGLSAGVRPDGGFRVRAELPTVRHGLTEAGA